MVLAKNSKAKLDLVNSDPRYAYTASNGPIPEDDYLNYRLGLEYDHYNKLRRDGHLNSKLQRRKQALLGRRIIIEYPEWEEVDGSVKNESIKFAQRLLGSIKYERLCDSLFEPGLLVGFAAVKVDWALDLITELLLPTFEFIPQNRINFSYYNSDPNIPIITGEKLSKQIPIKDQIVMADNYEVRLLTRKSPIEGERVPKGRIILFSFGSSKGLPGGCGLGYQLYPLIEIKKAVRNAWLYHSDRLGSPPILGTYPFNNTPKDESTPANVFDLKNPSHKEILETFENYLAAISPNGFGVFPEGFKAALVEAMNSSNPDVHERLIRATDNEVSEAILGEVGFSERPQGGSRAASESQVDDRDRNLTDSDCNLFDEQIESFWQYFWELNAPVELVRPVIRRWTTEDDRKEELEREKTARRKELAEADKILIDMGLKPSEDYVKREYGEEWSLAPKAPSPVPLPVNLAIPPVDEQNAAVPVDQSEWTNAYRRTILEGNVRGGFAGPLCSYPISSAFDLEKTYELSEFSDLRDSIRYNAVNICNRFGIQLTSQFNAWAEGHLIGDYASASRFVTWKGYKIGIEHEVGSTRFGRLMKIAYGYFANHIGADKEALDTYVGPHFSSDKIFRISQVNEDGSFDEYKYGILFETAKQFEKAYKNQMPISFFGGIEECSCNEIDAHHKLNMGEGCKDFAVFWKDFSTATIINAKDYPSVHAEASHFSEGRAIRGIRKLTNSESKRARQGDWVRLTTSKEHWIFTDKTPIEFVRRKLVEPSEMPEDFAEPIVLKTNSTDLSDQELDDIATNREEAEKEAAEAWQAIAPAAFRKLLIPNGIQ
jgi:Inorganic Pyrophosphatase/Protein of unknown function (DUF935)